MRYVESIDRMQMVLYPEKSDDLVTEENPVRVIDEFVNLLNLGKLGFESGYQRKTEAGRPRYSAECLLKLYVYGYYKKVRSSRRLMELCATNIEAMWLTGRLRPDFRTISDFRKENKSGIKKVFTAFVKISAELGLYHREAGVQDGSKFRAVNSKDKNVTEAKLAKKLEIVEEKIAKYLEEMDKNDSGESDEPKYTKEEIATKIEKLRARKERYGDLLGEMKEKGLTQVSFTDPESKLMKTANGGFDVSYNIQIIVDPESHMVGTVMVTDQCNDMGLLSPVTEKAKEELGTVTMDVTADKGYEDKEDMLECLMNGTIPKVPSKSGADSYEFELGYEEEAVTEEMLGSSKAEDIKACLEAGVLPGIYKDKGIEISVVEVEESVCDERSQRSFTLNSEGTAVICPNGFELAKVAELHNRGKTRFACRSACAQCTEKCTDSKFKQVDLKNGQTVLYAAESRTVKKVRIKLTPDRAKIRNRKCVVEHPFGTVKRWTDGSYTLLKGKEKVGADMSLLFLGYNLKQTINMVGMRGLIEKMRGMTRAFFRVFSTSTLSTIILRRPALLPVAPL
jgi:transposase